MKIIPVDCNYVESEFATSYLLIQNNCGFFVECNTNYAIPYLVSAVKEAGLSPEQVKGLCITHVHLDHAGGAGLFLRTFPQAKLYAHPRAARHAIDPSKLIKSATAVYGEAFMQKLYGDILPCDADRVVILEDGDEINFEGSLIQSRHTRGHANHHLVLIEPETKTLFSGDSFGVSYPSLHSTEKKVIVASSSPTDFDAPAARESVNWIAAQDLNQIALTHYGFIGRSDIPGMAKILNDELYFYEDLMKRIKAENLAEDKVAGEIVSWMEDYFSKRGVPLSKDDLRLLDLDFKVNAQGLCFVAAKA